MMIRERDSVTSGTVTIVVNYWFNHMQLLLLLEWTQIVRNHMLQSHSVTRHPHPPGDLTQSLT